NLEARLEESIALVNCVTVNGATPGADMSWSKLIQPLNQGDYDWAALAESRVNTGSPSVQATPE
ncbi:MAG: hypothetical protein KJ579_01200, partial [Verrucomicrobia bacterium]|nr:hypothetical protein [Verrucomicrobiota bacterium]